MGNVFQKEKELKVFEMLNCPKCGNKGMIRVTDDGNKNQDCLTCGRVLRRNGIKN
jgi:ribosomal protein S27E